MDSLNDVLNRTHSFTLASDASGIAQNAWTRHGVSRLHNLFVAVPTDLTLLAMNIILVPLRAGETKMQLKAISLIKNSKIFENLQSELFATKSFLQTVFNVIKYAISTLFTLILGTISPYANFKFHCATHMIVNQQEEKAQKILEEQARQLSEAKKKEAELMQQRKNVELARKKQTDVNAKKAAELAAKKVAEETAKKMAEEAAKKAAEEAAALKEAAAQIKAEKEKKAAAITAKANAVFPSTKPVVVKDSSLKNIATTAENSIKNTFSWCTTKAQDYYKKIFPGQNIAKGS